MDGRAVSTKYGWPERLGGFDREETVMEEGEFRSIAIPRSCIIIDFKLLFSIEGADKNLKKELDNLIKDLVQDSDYQVYKNTSTDEDAIWLYSMSEDKDK